ncbi:MAG: hypothetical protein KME30_10620 [Iphinoe sp. HA4291-MV1]|nr:hypothetical protein [Iphinoe sp. HA4291-MV1]
MAKDPSPVTRRTRVGTSLRRTYGYLLQQRLLQLPVPEARETRLHRLVSQMTDRKTK